MYLNEEAKLKEGKELDDCAQRGHFPEDSLVFLLSKVEFSLKLKLWAH
jgi:hypothetical protein